MHLIFYCRHRNKLATSVIIRFTKELVASIYKISCCAVGFIESKTFGSIKPEKVLNPDVILSNPDAILTNPDVILSNPDAILTLPLDGLTETLAQTHLLTVPKRRLHLPRLPATSVWG